MHRILHLNPPESFNEKLQWMKIYDHNEVYSLLVDKLRVKEYVAQLVGSEYVVPTLATWSDPKLIDLDGLPPEFVLKVNHNSGGNIICRDKSTFDIDKARAFLGKQMRRSHFWSAREWAYKDVTPIVFAEQYVRPLGSFSTVDYKFYCFGGEPRFLYVSRGLEHHKTAEISFLSLDWTLMPFQRADYQQFSAVPPRPPHFDRMLELARVLAEGFRFVRVDFYESADNPLFSEFTFYPAGGATPFEPPSADIELGRYLNVD